MNILGFNPSHHSSVCLLQDGEIKYFIQEERITRKKYDDLPFKSFIDILQNYNIDLLTWSSPSIYYPSNNLFPQIPYWSQIASHLHPNIKYCDFSHDHHKIHTSHAFYNSGFKEAICVIVDGLGSIIDNNNRHQRETETISHCSYPDNFKVLYKNITNVFQQVNLSRAYETITMHLGWSRNEAGKTMGLASYGKFNPSFPSFFNQNTGNPNVFYTDLNKKITKIHTETFVDETLNPQLKLKKDPKEWHYNESKITDLEKDLAWKIQNDTQQLVGDYIEKAIKETDLKQVCCAGGYFLNCVNNYYLQKRFPNVNFYFEPIANDSGMAIGSAKLLWHKLTQDITIRPFKSLYLGKQYSKHQLLKGIKKYI